MVQVSQDSQLDICITRTCCNSRLQATAPWPALLLLANGTLSSVTQASMLIVMMAVVEWTAVHCAGHLSVTMSDRLAACKSHARAMPKWPVPSLLFVADLHVNISFMKVSCVL